MDVCIVCCVFLMLLCSGTATSNENDGDDSLFECENGGTFVSGDYEGEGRCSCPEYYNGEHCEKFTDPCYESPCAFGATCTFEGGKMKCDCTDGYTGKLCDQEISPALNITSTTNPISMTNSESSSTASTNSMLTTTTPGTKYSPVSKEINSIRTVEPTKFTSTQTDGRSTEETYSSSNKNSDDPLSSLEENTSIATEYSTDSFFECENGGTFVSSDNEGEDRCLCADYFSGEHCERFIDPCYESPCRFGATCRFEDFKMKCDCDDGYTGELCDQEILSALNISSTTNPISMTNSESSSTVSTNSMLTTTTPGSEYSPVSKELNSIQTVEPAKFTSTQTDGRSTQETFSSSNKNSDDPLSSLEEITSITTEYRTDSVFKCENGGTFVSSDYEGEDRCLCPDYFNGEHCERFTNPCYESPCGYGATCRMKGFKMTCDCADGYTGELCDQEISTSSTISSTSKNLPMTTNEFNTTTENTELTSEKEGNNITEFQSQGTTTDNLISSDETSSILTTTGDSNTHTENIDSTSVKEGISTTETLSPDTTSDNSISSDEASSFGTTTEDSNTKTENINSTIVKEGTTANENMDSTSVKEDTTATVSSSPDTTSANSISSDETSSFGTTTEDSNTNTENIDSTSVKEDISTTEPPSPDTTSDDSINSNSPSFFGTTTDNSNIKTEIIYSTASKEDNTTPYSFTAETTQSVASTNTDDTVTEVEIDKKKASKRNVAYICGGIGGGLGIISFIVGIIYYLKRLKKRKHLLDFKSGDSSSMGSADSTTHLA